MSRERKSNQSCLLSKICIFLTSDRTATLKFILSFCLFSVGTASSWVLPNFLPPLAAPRRPPDNISWTFSSSSLSIKWDPVVPLRNESAVTGYKVREGPGRHWLVMNSSSVFPVSTRGLQSTAGGSGPKHKHSVRDCERREIHEWSSR